MGLFAFKRARARAAQRLAEQAAPTAEEKPRVLDSTPPEVPAAEQPEDLGTTEAAAPQPRTSRRRTSEEPTAS